MAPEDEPPSFEDFDARLARARRTEPTGSPPESDGGGRQRLTLGGGVQAGVEVLAGVIGGALVGWALDYWTGWRPLFVIVFFVLGAAAGLLNAYRHLRRMGMIEEGGPERDGAE